MANVPLSTRFIGISENVNLEEKKSATLNAETQPYTMADLVSTIGTGSQGPQGVEGPAGPPGPVGPAGLEWQGQWVSGTTYFENDAVGYNGASYFLFTADNVGSQTEDPITDNNNWALLASQGAIGPQGAQGPTGPQGAGATQTLQQTVENGNTINDGEGTILTINSSQVKIQDALGGKINIEYTSGNKPTIEFGIPSSGNLRTLLQTPDTQTGNRTIKFPDASGTIALQNYKSYVAQIIPESISVVTTNVLENTLGTTVTVSWVSGKINIVLGSEIITLTNPYLSASNYLQNGIYHVITPSLLGFDSIELASYKVNGSPGEGWSFGGRINFELRIYN